MKTTLRSLKLIIIDEVSMISSLNLVYMHLRMEELFGSVDWFGSKNVLFVGDLLQLPPVNGNSIFEKVSQKVLLHRLGCTTAINIWKEAIVYEELTINERQKKDTRFVTLLDHVRQGTVTEEDVAMLKTRTVDVPAAEKFSELSQSGKTPVCLFPTRRACDEFNEKMLNSLPDKVHKLMCVDDIDETSSTLKWTKRANKQLEKVNSDCNQTAGLQACLHIAVGARVMLRRNINTKAGLVNGAIGTVLSIQPSAIRVQFDHISEPYDVQTVKSRFILMKNFCIYRRQFPLVLAYAVTIHKCQGLSLDAAILDLSEEVFCAGMAYVALSTVCTLEGLYLLRFNLKSIIVSSKCLEEVNRLLTSSLVLRINTWQCGWPF